MDSLISSEKLTILSFVDPYISHLGISRANFLGLFVFSLFVILYFLFGKQIYQFKENTKAGLRSQVQAFTLKTQLSEDGKTLETTENPSFFARILSTLDNMFLTPDNETEGFEDGDGEDEDEEDDEDGDEDEDEEDAGDDEAKGDDKDE